MALAFSLGPIEERSSLEEPLEAKIPISVIGEEPIEDVSVRLASEPAFHERGLARELHLEQLDLEVVREGPGAPYIAVTTPDPFPEPFADLVIEVRWPGAKLLREYTVMLDPPGIAPPERPLPGPADSPLAVDGVVSVYELRTRNVVLQEWDLSCGAAALATVLRYQHGEEVSEREVALGLIDRPEYYKDPRLIRARHGFSLLDMRRYVERLGYDGVGLGQMGFDDLLERAPLIVPVDLHGFPHFVVFRGATEHRVLLADPAYGNLTVTRRRFEEAWIDYGEVGRVGFVVQRDGAQAPAGGLTPRPRDFVMLR